MKYSIILADVPWRHTKWAVDGRSRPGKYYPVMTTKEIVSLPIQKIVAEDAVLFFWTTAPHFPDALQVIQAWGFRYRTVGFTWMKLNKHNDRLFMGCGETTRANAEFCLLATRGKGLKRIARDVKSAVLTRRGRHSEKPAVVRDRIIQLYGDYLPKVELFAREENPGWHVFGNQVDNSIILPLATAA